MFSGRSSPVSPKEEPSLLERKPRMLEATLTGEDVAEDTTLPVLETIPPKASWSLPLIPGPSDSSSCAGPSSLSPEGTGHSGKNLKLVWVKLSLAVSSQDGASNPDPLCGRVAGWDWRRRRPPLSRPRRASIRRDAQVRAAPPHWPAGVRHTPLSHNNPLVRRLYDNVQFIKGRRFRNTFGRNPARPPSPEWEAGFNSWDEEELTIFALTPHCFPQSLQYFIRQVENIRIETINETIQL